MTRLADLMAADERFLSQEACEALAEHIQRLAQGGGTTEVVINSFWAGEMRWARNRVSAASDRRDISINIRRGLPAGPGALRGANNGVTTNQLDDASLEAAVRAAERLTRRDRAVAFRTEAGTPRAPEFELSKPAIWSEGTYGFKAEARAHLAPALIEPAEAAGMLTAGYLEVRAQEVAHKWLEQPFRYFRQTLAQCSTTTRDPEGTGSGWAGLSSYDIAEIDAPALAKRALDKCEASRHPVSLEPGRYTVILEPQAVDDLIGNLVRDLDPLSRGNAEVVGGGPFVTGYDNALGLVRSKLGLKVADERVTISHEPMDPLLGMLPFDMGSGEPYRPVTWIDHGVLTTLWYPRVYALKALNENRGYLNSQSYRMSGGTTSLEEMIQTTTRGLLVTRFSNLGLLDFNSLLFTGLTRDGLWLIENGKITKAVKNFRFTESPLFVLNSIEQLGVPVPVFSPGAPAVVPPLKAHDFSFTSLVDAV